MQSGCPHSQGGAFPAFQHRSKIGALASPQDNNVRPVPVVHPANGIQDMVATQYPGKVRVASSPVQLSEEQGDMQSQRICQGLHHQLESPASSGVLHPKPRHGAVGPRNSHHQISKDADFYSSAHVSVQHKSYFGTSAKEDSVRQSACSSAALQRDSLGVAAQTFPLQNHCPSVPKSNQQMSYPLLRALLRENPPSSPEKNVNIELSTGITFSDERRCTSQRVKRSRAAPNCGPTRMQDLDHSGGIHSKLYQQVSSPSLRCPPSIDKVSPVGEPVPATDDEIHNFIAKRLAYFGTILNQNCDDYGHAHSCSSQKERVERQSLHCAEIEQCSSSAAAGQALKENSSNGSKANAELTPKSSTGTLASAVGNSKRAPKTESVEKSASVNFDLPVTKRLDLTVPADGNGKLVCSDDCEDKTFIDSKDESFHSKLCDEYLATGMTTLHYSFIIGLDNVKGVTDVSEDLKTKSSSVVSENNMFELTSLIENQDANTKKKTKDEHCGVTCKEDIAHCKLNSSINEIEIHNVVSIPTNQSKWLCSQTSRGGAREDVASACSQTDLSIALPVNKVREQAALAESKGEEVNFLKDPRYEDISDDVSTLVTKVPEPNNKRSPVENEGYGHVQGQAKMKTGIISEEELIPKKQVLPKTGTLDIAQHCSCRRFVETDDCFEGLLCPKCVGKRHQGWQANHSLSCGPSFVLEDEDEIDDQMDDGWLVIPISMSDLKFEPHDEDQDCYENVVLDDGETGDKEKRCELHWPVPKPVPVRAVASSQIEVFDTVDSFLQAKAVQFEMTSGWSTPEHEIDSEKEPHAPQDRIQFYSEHEDSCETEDSCDYSSGSEHNYLTVSRQFLKKRSAHLPPQTDDPVSEKEDGKKLQQLIDADVCNNRVRPKTNGQNISKGDDIIVLDSDTDDESDQNCKEKAKRRRLFSSGSEDSRDAPCSQQRRHSPENVHSRCGTVKEKLKTQEACSDLSHSAEKSGHLIVTKAGTEQHKADRQKISKKGSVIILDSDTEDDQNYERENGKRLSCLGSADGGDAPRVQHKRHWPETVTSEHRTAKEKLQETKLSSDLSSLPRHQSVLHDTQFEEVMEDASSDLSQSIKKTEPLIEANGVSERVQQKTSRQISEESDNTPFAARKRPSPETVDRLCGTANKKPKKATPSSENSTKTQPPSVDKEADSPLGACRVIPRCVVQVSQTSHYLTLVKEDSRVLMEGKDETPKTPTATRKKTDSCEKNLDRNEEGRSVPKSKPANNRHHATKSTVQTNIAKPRLVSRQLSSPIHEGPSGSSGSSSSTSGQLSEARQSSASSSLLKSKQSTPIPRQHFSTSQPQRSRSYSDPSNLDHLGTPAKGPSPSATMQSSARTRVRKDWNLCYVSTRRDRKGSAGMEEDRRTTTSDSSREARPRPSHYDKAPKQRHNSHKPATRLMKQTMSDYRQWTKARSRDAPREQRYSVGEGYKWSEKPTVAKPSKGSGMYGKK